jgi:hypothetical protein
MGRCHPRKTRHHPRIGAAEFTAQQIGEQDARCGEDHARPPAQSDRVEEHQERRMTGGILRVEAAILEDGLPQQEEVAQVLIDGSGESWR